VLKKFRVRAARVGEDIGETDGVEAVVVSGQGESADGGGKVRRWAGAAAAGW